MFRSGIVEDFVNRKVEIDNLKDRICNHSENLFDEYHQKCLEMKQAHDIDLFEPGIKPCFGLLFSDYNELKYLDYSTMGIIGLGSSLFYIRCILADPDTQEVYYACSDYYLTLFSNHTSIRRPSSISSLAKHEGRVLDAGWYGIFIGDRNVFDRDDSGMEGSSIYSIESLIVNNHIIYGFIRYLDVNEDADYGLIQIDFSQHYQEYGLIHDYSFNGVNQGNVCEAVKVPYGSFRYRKFSVLTSAPLNYLMFNDKRIKGSEVPEGCVINAVKAIRLNNGIMDIVYSGNTQRKIISAKVDLENMIVLERENLIECETNSIGSLEPVFDYDLHKNLLCSAIPPCPENQK